MSQLEIKMKIEIDRLIGKWKEQKPDPKIDSIAEGIRAHFDGLGLNFEECGRALTIVQRNFAEAIVRHDKSSEKFGLGYICCVCKKPIADADIPKEVKEKISMQLVWHDRCRK